MGQTLFKALSYIHILFYLILPKLFELGFIICIMKMGKPRFRDVKQMMLEVIRLAVPMRSPASRQGPGDRLALRNTRLGIGSMFWGPPTSELPEDLAK